MRNPFLPFLPHQRQYGVRDLSSARVSLQSWGKEGREEGRKGGREEGREEEEGRTEGRHFWLLFYSVKLRRIVTHVATEN